MISDWLRGQTQGMVETVASLLNKLGLTPNALTLLGLLMMFGTALVLAQGRFIVGGLLLGAVSMFDALDGGLARMTNRVTIFGAFLDSTTDRIAEAAIYGGLIYWYMSQNMPQEMLLAYAAIVGSLMVSYTRARAEGVGIDCKVGWFTRFERLAVLGLGLLTGWMLPALFILALLSNVTAIQRILHVYQRAT
ncbi:MAG: CDP-alcohol phosphatidyltransferase family protein [Anaerolineales bacterium]|nr:CDP-alcohol phosphatidyltransferase family protein [Anaerolineales bacterium]MCB9128840.1 CDP-alcohol phosphatidyltransferase family protein [Ardenticatenales bacterium]MCB9171404.1 CDP-alcohol phosphatidyltransferase family protein [Ardenticatenales bacterium]